MPDTAARSGELDAPKAPQWRTRTKWILGLILDQWVLISMGLFILLAWLFPSVGKRGGHIRAEYTVTYGAVAIIFFISGLSLKFDQLVRHSRNIRLHLIVQIMSFLFTSAVFFAIACAGLPSSTIQVSTLVGLVATGCLPTTIASNVVMTRSAGGDEAATMVEVTVGNLLGPFITPLLLTKMYLPAVEEFKPWLPLEAIDNLPALYRQVMFQMGLSVFIPLFVGQVVRAIWTKKVQWAVNTFKLGKVGSIMLLVLVWSTFCTAFASGALKTINGPSITYNIFMNLSLCISFTILSFYLARPPARLRRLSPFIFKQLPKEETISICFCAPAKTQALGIPLIAAMYTTSDDRTQALLQVPMILYTAEQILVGQVIIALFKRWLAKDQEQATASEVGSDDRPEAAAEGLEMLGTESRAEVDRDRKDDRKLSV